MMPTRDEIIEALTRLEPGAFEDVINTAVKNRYPATQDVGHRGPDPQVTPEQFAQWLARRHLSTDASIERVVYLPAGAPENEIRLLEVNRLLNPPDPEVIEPLDFTPDSDLPYKVFVADITADQWEGIKNNTKAILPSGWGMGHNRIYTRA